MPTTHSDSDDLNFLYIFSWLEKVNESKLIVQPDELDDVNELEPSKNTTRRVQKWEVLKSPRDVSFFFIIRFFPTTFGVCVHLGGKVSQCQSVPNWRGMRARRRRRGVVFCSILITVFFFIIVVFPQTRR